MAVICGFLVVNVVSTFFGTIGNALVIAKVRMNPTLQIISNFWLVSLAVADLLVTALGQPVFVVWQIGGDCNAIITTSRRFKCVIQKWEKLLDFVA